MTLSVDALRQSTNAALAAFCESQHGRLVGVLTMYTGDRHLAEELAQDTLVRVVTHWRKVSRLDSPEAWTHRVALNLANSSFRRSLAHRRAMARLGRRDDTASAPDTTTGVALRQAVAALPDRQRTALALRYFADLPARDVAAIMTCQEGTVGALVHQAIANLRRVPGFESMEPTDD